MLIYYMKVNNNFCPVPWISLHAWADGNMFPCCKSDSKELYDNYSLVS